MSVFLVTARWRNKKGQPVGPRHWEVEADDIWAAQGKAIMRIERRGGSKIDLTVVAKDDDE